MLIATSLLATLLPLAAAATPIAPVGDDLHRDWIAADADWVVRVDVASALESELSSLLNEVWESDEFAEVQQELGFDPRRDLSTVTIYGSAADPENPVVLVEGDARLEQALDRLSSKAHRASVNVGGISLDRWSEDESDSDAVYTYLARRANSEQRILVVSPRKESTVTGTAVLRGEQANLMDEPSALASDGPSAGAFLYISASEGFSKFEDWDPASQVAQLVQSAVLEAGEFKGEAFLGITVGTADEESARQITSIVQGASALLSLAAQSEEEARALIPLIQGLTVQNDGARVSLRLRHPSAKLIQMAQEHGHNDNSWSSGHHEQEDYNKPKSKPKPAPKKDGWY